MIRPCRPSDAAAICAIYNPYVLESIITFEEEPVTEAEMAQRIREIGGRLPWLAWEEKVGEEEAVVAGYAYATPWKSRSAYGRSVETTVYVSPDFARRGIGASLYGTLLGELRALGLHCALGGISLPNPASIALHEKLGFRKVGHLEEVGWKFGRWIDVGYWQLIL